MPINTTTFFITQSLKPFTENFSEVSENYLWRSSFLLKLQLGRQQICTSEDRKGSYLTSCKQDIGEHLLMVSPEHYC